MRRSYKLPMKPILEYVLWGSLALWFINSVARMIAYFIIAQRGGPSLLIYKIFNRLGWIFWTGILLSAVLLSIVNTASE